MNSKKIKPRVLCIIPARGGSKGLKLKNIQKVSGKPLIFYPIAAAMDSKVCDEIFVSTDSKKIANYATKYGANVPFLRSKRYSKDYTTTESTLQNALLEYEKFSKKKFDICVFLTANRIFRKSKWIKDCVNNLIKNVDIESSFTVNKTYKHFWHKKNGKYCKVLPWMKTYTSRQLAPEFYREDSALVCASRSYLWRKGLRIGKKIKFVNHDFPFAEIDIHSKEDLFIANSAMNYLLKNKKNKPF